MGTKCCTTKCGEDFNENEEEISKSHFLKHYPIGKGGYGRVSNKNINLLNKSINIGMESSI